MIRCGGFSAGIKPSGDLDLALFLFDRPLVCAGVFTQSQTAAAPVAASRRVVGSGEATAIVINSGCANAGTGPLGDTNARQMQVAVADRVSASADSVLVCSTGPIGPQLPIEQIQQAVAEAQVPDMEWTQAAEAIRTTDTFAKTVTTERDGVTVWGMAKGAAMVRPNMATMLAVLVTNADVDAPTLDGGTSGQCRWQLQLVEHRRMPIDQRYGACRIYC